MTDEPARARDFYRSVLGWHALPVEAATGEFTLDNAHIATIGPPSGPVDLAKQSLWLVAFGTADPIETHHLIIDAGGRRLTDAGSTLANVLLFEDDQGTVFGVRSSS